MRICLTIAIAMLLVGCETETKSMHGRTAAPPEESSECKGAGSGVNRDDCTILVDVELRAGGCTVVVDRSQDDVDFARGATNKWIVWQINKNPGGYRFSRDGVVFKSDPDSNFTSGKAIANGQIYHWKNRNEAPRSYSYTVKVESRNASIKCEQDPRINNR